MSLSEKLKSVSKRMHFAHRRWEPRKNYQEALQIYASIEDYVRELSPEKESDMEQINMVACEFHKEAARLLMAIGEDEQAKEHMMKALELHPPEHLRPTFLLPQELPVLDPASVEEVLWKHREESMKLPYTPSPARQASDFVKLAEVMIDAGKTEDAHRMLADLLDAVKKEEDAWDEELPLMAPRGVMKPMECHTLSHACEMIGRVEEAQSYLEKAGKAATATIEVVEEREKNIYMNALICENAGTIFERLDPQKAFECYERAERLYVEALRKGLDPYEYDGFSYDQEFKRQLGYLWPLFRFDIFARLALRRQRVLAVIDGEAGYPLRREPRSVQ